MADEAGGVAASTDQGAPSRAKTIVMIIALATAFAIVPRVTRSCQEGALSEDAPDFEARVVANADALNGVTTETEGGAPKPGELALRSLRGHPVILDFWATWCGPCQAESPIVNTIAQRYKDRGLVVVGVNTSDAEELVAPFVKRKGLGFPIVYDANNAIARSYAVHNLPTLIVVSKTGKIAAIRNGITSDAALDEIVQRYL